MRPDVNYSIRFEMKKPICIALKVILAQLCVKTTASSNCKIPRENAQLSTSVSIHLPTTSREPSIIPKALITYNTVDEILQ